MAEIHLYWIVQQVDFMPCNYFKIKFHFEMTSLFCIYVHHSILMHHLLLGFGLTASGLGLNNLAWELVWISDLVAVDSQKFHLAAFQQSNTSLQPHTELLYKYLWRFYVCQYMRPMLREYFCLSFVQFWLTKCQMSVIWHFIVFASWLQN